MQILKSNVKIVIRSLSKKRTYALINIIGLVISFTACLILSQFVFQELSYEKSIPGYDRIFRLQHNSYLNGNLEYKKAQVFPGVGPALKEEFSQIKESARIFPIYELFEPQFEFLNGRNQVVRFQCQKVFAADNSLLSVFSFSFLEGDGKTALAGANKIIVSQSAVDKYFGKESPVDKSIDFGGFGTFQITGIYKDLPVHSHLQADFIISWMEVYEERHVWTWDGFPTYVLLEEGTNPHIIEQQLSTFVKKHVNYKRGEGLTSQLSLQPVKDIHLNSNLRGEISTNGSREIVYGLLGVLLLVLIMALVNYTNLSIAHSIKRSKEMGVHKILGSSRSLVFSQFYLESCLLNLVALIVAFPLAYVARPYFENISGSQLTFSLWTDYRFWLAVFVLQALMSLAATAYPARVIFSIPLINSLKGEKPKIGTGFTFKKGLIVFQFMVSIILVAVSYFAHQQIIFLKDYDKGFSQEEKVVLKTYIKPGEDSLHQVLVGTYKEKLLSYSSIKRVTTSSTVPGTVNIWAMQSTRPVNGVDISVNTNIVRVDEDYFDAYGIKVIEGRNFSENDHSNGNEILLNETAVGLFNFSNANSAIGATIQLFGERKVVGVVKNFHERSLKYPIQPAVYITRPGPLKFITIELETDDAKGIINILKSEWDGVFQGYPFEYFFLNELFNNQYRSENNTRSIFILFAIIAMGIACLGLFGFTMYTTIQRSKEIAIRKVLGASNLGLIQHLNRELFLLFLISTAISVPIIFMTMNKWLSNFVLRIQLEHWQFAIPFCLVGLISLLSANYNVLSVLRKNPTESLSRE